MKPAGVVAILGLAVLCSAAPAAAAAAPAAALPRPVPIRFVAADSVALAGQWFPAPARGPSVVLAPRRRGSDPELLALAVEFQKRGFGALVFALRDSQPHRRESDTLRYAVMTSNWVNDMVGALRAVRARHESTGHVFAWGQGLGGALAVSAAARELGLCDALAAEDVFPNADFVMRRNGTAVIPEAVKAQARLLGGRDEPFSAAARLNLPVYAILVGAGAGRPDDVIQQTLRRNRGRTDRWLRPGVESPAPLPGPAQVDTLVTWFRRWAAFPPSK